MEIVQGTKCRIISLNATNDIVLEIQLKKMMMSIYFGDGDVFVEQNLKLFQKFLTVLF